MDQNFMKEKPIFPLLMSLAVPMILSMLVNSLYNIVDSIFVAKISEESMTALSLVFPIQNLIAAIAVGFGVGINAVIAMSLGAKNNIQADIAATQGLILSILHGIFLTVIGLLIMPKFLNFFTDDIYIIQAALEYSKIVLLFSVVITSALTYEKIFQAVGKMSVTMISLLSGCIINIILDPIMIFGFKFFPAMGIKGAAWATGIGQLTSLIVYFIAYAVAPINVKPSFKYLSLNKKICFQLYSIGIPATLNIALPSVLVSALNGILASFSQSYVLVLGIYYKLQTFLYLPANGVLQGMRPLISYNYGAKEYQRVHKIYKTALLTIVTIMTIGMVLCFAIPGKLISMFTENSATLNIGIGALRIISFGFIVSSFSVVSAGALEALGKGVHSFIISLLRYVIIIIPTAYILTRTLGVAKIWNAFWIAEFITAFIAYKIYTKILSKN